MTERSRNYTVGCLVSAALFSLLQISGHGTNAAPSVDMGLRHRLVGSWKVVSFTDVSEEGETVDPYGTTPTGLMLCSANGHFSLSVMAGPKVVAPEDMKAFSLEEWHHQFLNSFGTYHVNNSQTVIFHIDGCSWPDYNGTDQVRKCRIDRDTLVFYGDYSSSKGGNVHYEHVFRRCK